MIIIELLQVDVYINTYDMVLEIEKVLEFKKMEKKMILVALLFVCVIEFVESETTLEKMLEIGACSRRTNSCLNTCLKYITVKPPESKWTDAHLVVWWWCNIFSLFLLSIILLKLYHISYIIWTFLCLCRGIIRDSFNRSTDPITYMRGNFPGTTIKSWILYYYYFPYLFLRENWKDKTACNLYVSSKGSVLFCLVVIS